MSFNVAKVAIFRSPTIFCRWLPRPDRALVPDKRKCYSDVCTKRSLSDGRRPSVEPMRFSGSEADWDSRRSFKDIDSRAPSYQPICVVLSLSAFLIYFLMLREENDIDEYLNDQVYFYVDPYAEAAKIKRQLALDLAAGKDCSTLEKRLEKVMALLQAKRGDVGLLQESLDRIKASKNPPP